MAPKSSLLSSPQSGRIDVSEAAITAIVRNSVAASYGVVGTVPRSLGAAIGRRLGQSHGRDGVVIAVDDGRIRIDLAVTIEYGTPVFTVARNVMKTVIFQVEQALGMPVERVDVHVQGLRVSAESGRQ